ncbi:type IV secretory system conjugative DNA transfer family protein [Priestia flexa]|uniref:type IV secretory system conjugative DNA transfer family protein n=1 Tax=Priestia flexa TaxID=86664 RepID=UPI003FD53E5F
MNISTKTLREFFFFLFIGLNAFLSYKISLMFNTSHSVLGGGSSSFSFDGETLTPLLITFVILSVVESIIFLLLFKKFGSSKALATSRLLNSKQVKSEQRQQKSYMFHSNKKSKDFKRDKSGLLVSQNLKLETSRANEHTVVIASTGGGKTSSILIPQLLSFDNTSIVVTDPKAEIHNITSGIMRSKGYKVYHLNLYDISRSIGFDLLRSCKSIEDVEKLSESLLSNAEGDWGKLSENLLTAVLIKVYANEGTVSDAVDLLAGLSVDPVDLENTFADSHAAAKLAVREFLQTLGSDGLISSIFKTIQSELKVFKRQSMRDIQKQNLFDVMKLREEKSILYISYPEDESRLYSSFLSSFYYTLFNKTKNFVREDQQQEFYPIQFLIDEFANIGRIPEFSTFLSTIRSKKMGVEIFLQSVDQLEKNYKGEENIILENCKTKVVMSGVSSRSAQTFADLVGKEQYKSISHSMGDNHSSSSVSDQTKEVLSADDIRRMKSYEILIVSDNLRPIKDDKNYYFMNKIQFFIFKYSPFSQKVTRKIMERFKSKK